MCGIAGFTRFSNKLGNQDVLLEMGKLIEHRGPDDNGIFINDYIGLCHQRLSVIDLSSAGKQPMQSDDGNLHIVFNGEIYNFQQLRTDLIKRGYHFVTETDTEVILALFKFEGRQCLTKLQGMFAIAIWDSHKQELFLARDRLGKKPLYYYNKEDDFVFSSEIKSILAYPGIKREIREDALYDYMTYLYVPEPKSIFKNIYKLESGHWLKINKNSVEGGQYWDLDFSKTTTNSEQVIQETLLENLKSAVKSRMISDVPIGGFLSGGVDSSAIVGLMAKVSTGAVVTCSVGFNDKKHDETAHARKVSEIFSTNHHEFTVEDDIAQSIEKIAVYFDEPFADPSMLPTYFVAKLAKKKVTVAIAGDGGDENFAGYNKYGIDNIENELRNKFPLFVRQYIFKGLAKLLSGAKRGHLKKAYTLLNSLSKSASYGFFLSNSFCTQKQWLNLANQSLKQKLGTYHPCQLTEYYYHKANSKDHLDKILYTDFKTYLPGDILVKVDRMSMANSLEVRAPLLDHELVQYIATIPSKYKIHQGNKKYIFKQSLNKLLPKSIVHRKKQGFTVPLADWFRKDIKVFTEQLLFHQSNGLQEYFNIDYIEELWQEHQDGNADHATVLWSLVMFCLWYKHYILVGESE